MQVEGLYIVFLSTKTQLATPWQLIINENQPIKAKPYTLQNFKMFIFFQARVVLVTTGLKDTTQRVQNL